MESAEQGSGQVGTRCRDSLNEALGAATADGVGLDERIGRVLYREQGGNWPEFVALGTGGR
ncbi:hypothetical protein BIWAKO_04806 [Bosea sp. BIWAKO-01]|nr:hypothetical protein BIWAKO_04806 [Bosea sp. BIWAKO-01]